MSVLGWTAKKVTEVSPDLAATRKLYTWAARQGLTRQQQRALVDIWDRAVRAACKAQACSDPGSGYGVPRVELFDSPAFHAWKWGRDMLNDGIVVDLEWDPSDNDRILAFGWSEGPHAWASSPGLVPERVARRVVSEPIIEYSKSDARVLLDLGVDLKGPIVDLMTMAWTLNENQDLHLDQVVLRYLREGMDKRLRRIGNKVLFRTNSGKLVPIAEAPKAQLYEYCRDDVRQEYRLFKELVRRLQKHGLLDYYRDEELPFTRVLIDMERAGIPIDIVASEELRQEVEDVHALADANLHQMGNLPSEFNLNSDDQVGGFLFSKDFHIDVSYRKGEDGEFPAVPEDFEPESAGHVWLKGSLRLTGLGLRKGMLVDSCEEDRKYDAGGMVCGHEDGEHKASVSKTALRMNKATREHPWVQAYLEYSKVHKLLTTYLRVFPEIVKDGRIYTHFNQTGTVTGRLSSSDINFQNIPVRGDYGKRIRSLFVSPEPLPFLHGDWSQLELRILASKSGDERLMRYFQEGEDPFIGLASEIFGRQVEKDSDDRKQIKNLVYALNYGAFAEKIAEMLTMEGFPTSIDTAQGFLDALYDLIPGVFDYREGVIAQAHKDGYVTTLAGRRRHVRRALDSPEWKIAAKGERAAANAEIQGSAADIVRRTMVRFVRDYLRLLAQIHDELLYQYLMMKSEMTRRNDIAALKHMAETGHGFDLRVPLVFEPKIVTSWGEK